GKWVQKAVKMAQMLSQLCWQARQMIVVRHVDFEQQGNRIELLEHPGRQAQGPGEVGDHDRCSLALGDLGHVEADGGVECDAGNKDVLALEYAHRCPFCRRKRGAVVAQWPMPRPPSTGMSAPVM